MKSYETKEVQLTCDDIFELKRLRERAEVESRDSIIAHDIEGGGGPARVRMTDDAREATHAVETLNRILRQAQS